MGFYSATGGNLTQEEHSWLESLAKYTPNMYDVNPAKQNKFSITVYSSSTYQTNAHRTCIVCGYDVISMYKYTANNIFAKFVWEYADGSISDVIDFTASSYGIGWHDFKIPENAIAIRCYGAISGEVSSSYGVTHIALFTKDSPYNPFNQS